jgi:hypothetical protein
VSLLVSLAYRPFLEPLHIERYWYLLIVPISFFIAMAYKAVRVSDLRRYWLGVGVLTVQIVLGMAALGVFAFLFVQYIAPTIVPR